MSDGVQGFAPPADNRPKYTFVVPESARSYPTDPHTITLAGLRVSEEDDAGRVASPGGNTNALALIVEYVRRSVVAIDDKPVSWDAGGAEWYERASPKVRSLARFAYHKVNSPEDEEQKAFLGSMKVTA